MHSVGGWGTFIELTMDKDHPRYTIDTLTPNKCSSDRQLHQSYGYTRHTVNPLIEVVSRILAAPRIEAGSPIQVAEHIGASRFQK